MNKYIKTDLEQGITYIKIAIINALYDIDSGEEEINMSKYISKTLLEECLKMENWSFYNENDEFIYYMSQNKNYIAIRKSDFKFFKENNINDL